MNHVITSVRASVNTEQADHVLIEAARKGDKAAFTALVRRYEEVVYKFSFQLCRNREEARETLQDTFISVYRGLASFDGRSKLTTWLYRIVTNHCLMKRRRRKIDTILESYDQPPADREGHRDASTPRWNETPADTLLKNELREILDTAIMKLPVEYRAVFVLRDIEGKSNAETATIMKLSVEATKSRLRRARAFLRDELYPYLATHSGDVP
jgi:RNA polymerase sigma-70 factor (ECF subfamily)